MINKKLSVRLRRFFTAVCASMLVVSATPMTALAAPKATEITAEQTQALNDMDLSFMFDAELYASLYPDVVAKVGNDPQALYQHFITFGINENRQFNRYFKVQDMENLFREYKTKFGDNHRLYVALAAQTLLEKATGTENVVATPDVMKTISTEQLNAQLALMQNRVAEIEKQIVVLETQLTEETSQETSQETSSGSSEQTEENKVILTKIQQLKVALNKYKNAVTLISEATELLTEAQSTASKIEDNLDQLELAKKYAVERIEDDNAKLASAQAALASAISQYQTVATELTSLCNDLASSLQTVATDTHYIDDNKKRISDLTDTLDQMTEKDEKYAALSADLEHFKQETEALKADRESATSTASGLRNDIADTLSSVTIDAEPYNELISDAEAVANLNSDIDIYTQVVKNQDHIIEMEKSRLNDQKKIIENLESLKETDEQNKAAAVEETYDVLESFEDSDIEELGSEENQELRDDLHKFLDAENKNIQDDITDDGSDDDVNNDDTDDGNSLPSEP